MTATLTEKPVAFSDGFFKGLASRTKYIYDGTDIVLDFVDADGEGITESPELAKRYLWGPAVDQLLAQEDATGLGTPADVTWPLTDHLGTVRDVIDSAGNVLTHFQIDAFGSITAGDTTLIRYIYTAQEYDPESGLYYYDARYYDPVVGKFISEDLIGFDAEDANMYRYAGNIPTAATDPDGLEIITVTAESEQQQYARPTPFELSQSLYLPPGPAFEDILGLPESKWIDKVLDESLLPKFRWPSLPLQIGPPPQIQEQKTDWGPWASESLDERKYEAPTFEDVIVGRQQPRLRSLSSLPFTDQGSPMPRVKYKKRCILPFRFPPRWCLLLDYTFVSRGND